MVIMIQKLTMKNKARSLIFASVFIVLSLRCSHKENSFDNVIVRLDAENCLMFSYLENDRQILIDSIDSEIRISLDGENSSSYISLYLRYDSAQVEDANFFKRISNVNYNYVFNYKLDGSEIQVHEVIQEENLYIDYIIYKNSQANLILYSRGHICPMVFNNFSCPDEIIKIINSIHISVCK